MVSRNNNGSTQSGIIGRFLKVSKWHFQGTGCVFPLELSTHRAEFTVYSGGGLGRVYLAVKYTPFSPRARLWEYMKAGKGVRGGLQFQMTFDPKSFIFKGKDLVCTFAQCPWRSHENANNVFATWLTPRYKSSMWWFISMGRLQKNGNGNHGGLQRIF